MTKLTRRQREFLNAFLDLYRKASAPLHYSVVAKELGVGNASAYEMLRLLEEHGFVASTYALPREQRRVGRPAVLFYPTDKAASALAELAGGEWDEGEWELVKERILNALREGKGGSYEKLLDELLARIPERKSPLLYTTEMVTALVLTLYNLAEKTASTGPLRLLRRLSLPDEPGLDALAGLTMGLSLVERANRRLTSLLLSYIDGYQAHLKRLKPRHRRSLSSFMRELIRLLSSPQSKPAIKAIVAVVTDSGAYLPEGLAEEYDIRIIPVRIMMEGRYLRDRLDISPRQFYSRFGHGKPIPKPSPPDSGEFLGVYTELSQEMEAVVSIHTSRQLLDAIGVALSASRALPSFPIHVLDSRSTSMGLGFVVLEAARAARQGKGLTEVVKAAEALIFRVNMVLAVKDPWYLQQSGLAGRRLSGLNRFLGGKPIVELREGQMRLLKRARGREGALQSLLRSLSERTDAEAKLHVAVVHADAPEEARALKKEIAARFDCAELYIAPISPVLGACLGPGTVGLAFYAD